MAADAEQKGTPVIVDDPVREALGRKAMACLDHVREVGFGSATSAYSQDDVVSGFRITVSIDVQTTGKIEKKG